MLKFKNRDKDGKDYLVKISMFSVQGGIVAEFDKTEIESEKNEKATIFLTPMDAAAFVHNTRKSDGLSCRQVGHGADSITLSIRRIPWGSKYVDDHYVGFIGDRADAVINAGLIEIDVPVFVVEAMRICIERMMESLFFPSTGSDEEEFG